MVPTAPVASSTLAGIVSTGAQNFAGAKTFDAAPIIATLTARGALVASATKQVTSLALTNGQIVIGSTGADPVAASLAATTNQTTVTPGAGTLAIGTVQDINTNSSVTFGSLTLGNALNLVAASGNVVMNMQPTTTFTTAQYFDFAFQPIYTGTTRTTAAFIRFQRISTTDGAYSGIFSVFTRLSGAGFLEACRFTERQCMVSPGSITPDATGRNTLVLGLSTVPTTSPADQINIFAADASAGNCTLGIRTEAALVTESVTSDRTLAIVHNGTVVKLCIKA